MLAKMRALVSVCVFIVVFFIASLYITPPVFAADPGCNAQYPSCYLESPAWSSGNCITSSCTIPARPGDVIEFDSNICCRQPTLNTQSECGTAQKNSSGQLVCRTGGGDIAIDTAFLAPDAWSWCGQVLTGNPCCSNQGGNGNARCQRMAAEAAAKAAAEKQEKQATVDFDLCKQTKDDAKCTSCFASKGVWTAVGCVNWNYSGGNGIAATAIKLGLGIGGGVVLIMILAGAFKLTTSKGDPKATEEAKEMITNAIGGLLFILFSIVIVRTIGVGLLQIPGF